MINCSKTFKALFMRLSADGQVEGSLNLRQSLQGLDGENDACLRSIVRHLGGEIMSTYLSQFLATYPSRHNSLPFLT